MNLDIDLSFAEIEKAIGKPLREQLLDIQKLTISRDSCHKWASKLRLLVQPSELIASDLQTSLSDEGNSTGSDADSQPDSSSVNSSAPSTSSTCACNELRLLRQKGLRSLQLTAAGAVPECSHYVAVSYCWHMHYPMQTHSELAYTIHTENHSRANRAPSDVLRRAIAYAEECELSAIWIDQECIDQENQIDKEDAIQSMDLVYRNSFSPLGLLQSCITEQAYLDVFALLMDGKMLNLYQIMDLAGLLDMLKQEVWFSRAWILQESTAGGLNMQLLLQHEPSLTKATYFGNMDGELQFTIYELLECLAWADVVIDNSAGSLPENTYDRVSSAHKKVISFLPPIWPAGGFDNIISNLTLGRTCNSAQALAFLRGRKNSRTSDRLAILGNLCNYSIRINTTGAEEDNCSFSVCALALALFNGDMHLLHNYVSAHDSPPLAYGWGPPSQARLSHRSYREEDDEIFRYHVGKLTAEGLSVLGRLWEVEGWIDMRDVQQHFLAAWTAIAPQLPLVVLSASQTIFKVDVSWQLIKTLLSLHQPKLADMIWRKVKQPWLQGTHPHDGAFSRSNKVLIPASLSEILDLSTGEMRYSYPPVVCSEADYRELLDEGTTFGGMPWFVHTVMETGRFAYGRLRASNAGAGASSAHVSMALFDGVVGPGELVFTPSTTLDTLISQGRPHILDHRVHWKNVDVVGETGERNQVVIRCKGPVPGFWSVEEDDVVQNFILS